MLEISTNKENAYLPIVIDGEKYRMKSYGILPFKDYVKLQSFSRSYQDILEKGLEDLSEVQIEAVSESLDTMVAVVLENVPKSVIDALGVMNKLAVITHFTKTVPQAEETSTVTQEKSSQDLQGSMEGVQQNG